MDLLFPDGTRIRASSLVERREDDSTRSFGLYLDERWQPSWPADMIEWQDFGVPADGERAVAQIESAFARARGGEGVEIGCLGGLGRTGTVLACMAILAGVDPAESVAWVRRHYRPEAVETAEQEAWVAWFGQQVRGRR
jgi:protein-tyrosine phosphatase